MNSKGIINRHLPDSPGVYIFRDYRKRPMYIGRATSLRDRVRSYTAADVIVSRGPRIVDMFTRAKSVTWESTDSVLEAIILESILIKKYQPYYNVAERDDKSSLYVVITDEQWPRVFTERARDFETMKEEEKLPYKVKKIFGPYPDCGLIKEVLKILRKIFPFKDKKSLDPRHDAFYKAIGKSPDGDDDAARRKYNRTVNYLILFFEGKKGKLKASLEKQMKVCAKEMQFEEAGRLKRIIYAIDHINDIALIKREDSVNKTDFRIEGFDIAHLSGMETVGGMAVIIRGELALSEYRMFKVSQNRNNDIAGLVEILSRRLNHTEWTYPDLIVVDGNENQLKYAENVLKARRISIPIVAVTKNEKHKVARIIGHPEVVSVYQAEIIAVNAEVHRFTLAYHRRRRRLKNMV